MTLSPCRFCLFALLLIACDEATPTTDAGEATADAGDMTRADAGPWNPTADAGESESDAGTAPDAGAPEVMGCEGSETLAGTWTGAPSAHASGGLAFNTENRMHSGLEFATPFGEELVILGDFTIVDFPIVMTEGVHVDAQRGARFDGSTWSPLLTTQTFDSLPEAAVPFGPSVIVGGFFSSPTPYVGAWLDGTLYPMGALNRPVRALFVHGGEVYAGGMFTEDAGAPMRHLARWDRVGRTWVEIGGGTSGGPNLLSPPPGERPRQVSPGDVYAMTSFTDPVSGRELLVVGGNFEQAGATTANHVAGWDADREEWVALGAGLNSRPYAFAVYRDDLFATGDFTESGGVPVNHLARWDGVSWSPVGDGLVNTAAEGPDTPSAPTAIGRGLSVDAAGRLIVGGLFDCAGGVSVRSVAAWDGTRFSAMGAGLAGVLEGLAQYRGRTLAVGYILSDDGAAGYATFESP